jgi:hypothetical protein
LPRTDSDPSPTGGLVLLRFNADGFTDASFGQQGVVQFDTNADPLGPFSVYRPPVSFDDPPEMGSSSGVGPVESDLVWTQTAGVIVRADGTIVVAGDSQADAEADGVNQGLVVRLNADGSPDTIFGPDGTQFTTFVATAATYLAGDPGAISTAPDGSILVVGSLNVGTYGPSPEPLALVLLDFQDAPPGGPVTPLPGFGASAALQNPAALSDAVFQALAAGGSRPNAGAVVFRGANNLFAPPLASPATAAIFPIPTESQSESVARLSGGGDQPITADDPFALTGEPDRIGNLVLAGAADEPG